MLPTMVIEKVEGDSAQRIVANIPKLPVGNAALTMTK